MVAAAKDLGFAGAHIGGFGLSHKDFMTILERAAAIGGDWRGQDGRTRLRVSAASSTCFPQARTA